MTTPRPPGPEKADRPSMLAAATCRDSGTLEAKLPYLWLFGLGCIYGFSGVSRRVAATETSRWRCGGPVGWRN